jgi:hypothetical protein
LDDAILLGEVIYCRDQGGGYYVGIELEQALCGLADLASKDTWYWHLLRLHRLGARAAADLAEVGRARRDPAIERDAVRRGAHLREAREGIVAASLALQTGRAADESRAEAETAAAEDSRLQDTPEPAAWRAALARWRAQDRPYLVAYVRYREAEASLALGDRANAVLTSAGCNSSLLLRWLEWLLRALIAALTEPIAGARST